MSLGFDFSEMDKLAADLADAPAEVIPRVRKAVEVTARGIKDSWRDAAKSKVDRGHAKRYPSSIDYDMLLDTDGVIGAEIGPSLTKAQGALGFLEDAPGGVRSTPQRNREKSLADNIEDFERGLLKATEVNGL